VRLVDLADPRPVQRIAADVLPPAEQWRAQVGSEEVRRRRVLLRAALRETLGDLLGMLPREVPLAEVAGRPVLCGAPHDLSVSCSAAGHVGVVAVADGRAVGVDVERSTSGTLPEALAEGWLHPVEADRLAALPRRRRPEALVRCWTQKEAVLKAAGTGLRRHPATVRTPVAPGGRVERYEVVPLAAPRGHVASLAVADDPAGTAVVAVGGTIRGAAW
jgi:4'-phosphopantetheinyl transferase